MSDLVEFAQKALASQKGLSEWWREVRVVCAGRTPNGSVAFVVDAHGNAAVHLIHNIISRRDQIMVHLPNFQYVAPIELVDFARLEIAMAIYMSLLSGAK